MMKLVEMKCLGYLHSTASQALERDERGTSKAGIQTSGKRVGSTGGKNWVFGRLEDAGTYLEGGPTKEGRHRL